jgi:fused signal recognition particle receptor
MNSEFDNPQSAVQNPGWFERLKAGLRRTRDLLTRGLRGSSEDVEAALLEADVGVKATRELLERIRTRGGDRASALRAEIVDLLSAAGSRQPGAGKPQVIMIVGVNGSGKTTTVGKLAHLIRRQDRTVIVAASDTYRDAAAPQLQVWAERAGVEIVFSERGQDAAAVAFDAVGRAQARSADVVLVDTAGRLHTRRDLMDEAKKIKRVLGKVRTGAPDEIWLVLDATVGQNGIVQARSFDAELGLTGLIVTKLDGTAKGGVLIPIALELKLPIHYVGVGEDLEDLQAFNAREFTVALLGSE